MKIINKNSIIQAFLHEQYGDICKPSAMHYQIYQAPFIRLLPPLVAGILLQHFFDIPGWIIYPFTTLVFLLLIYFRISGLADHFNLTKWFGFAVYSCLFFIGTGLPVRLEVKPHEPGTRSGTILQVPLKRGNSYQVILGRLYDYSHNSRSRLEGKALVYLSTEVDSTLIIPGNRIIFHSGLDTVSRPKNPLSFNARRFYHNRKIYWKAYLNSNRYRIIETHDPGIIITAQRYRMKLINLIYSNSFDHPEIITALLTGYREGLDKEDRRMFAGSGAMHIMAVSGLHTGLIYGMISMFFSVFFRRNRILRLLIPLPFVWVFALITGLSPSVSRAALMITLFVLEACLRRQKNYYNVLFFSAFVLIVLNPSIIFEVSFQLSFTAVFGIVSCFIPAYRRCKTGRYIPDMIIGLLLISAFAQLFTFPLSVYYFHIFPLFFLLTNLLVVPLVPLIIYSGAFYFATQFLPALLALSTNILNLLSGSLIHIIRWVSNLPASVIDQLYFRPVEVVLYYGIILCGVAWIKQKRTGFLFGCIVTVLLLMVIDMDEYLDNYKRRRIHVYHNYSGWVCDIIERNHHVILSDETDTGTRRRLNSQLQNYWLSMGLEDQTYLGVKNISRYKNGNISICKSNRIEGLLFIDFCSYRMGIISCWPDELSSSLKPLKLDCLFLCGEGRFSLDHLLNFIEPGIIVIDRNVSYYQSKKWEMFCHHRSIPVHSIYRQGYFIKDLY